MIIYTLQLAFSGVLIAWEPSKYLILKPLSSMTRKSYTRGELKENERMFLKLIIQTSNI